MRNRNQIVAISVVSLLMVWGTLILILVGSTPQPAIAQDDDDATITPTPLPPPPLVELNENNIKRATVFLMQVLDSQTGPVVTCVGSGTLVSADGLIVTNAHVVLADSGCRHDRVVVSLTLRLDEPPVPNYVADIIDFNKGLDLAVLRITTFLDGRPVEQGSLQLPFVELGDSGDIRLDDTVLIAGYTDIGNTPVQTVRGSISGFTAESRVGDRAWLRTNAPVPGVASGGGAYDRLGRLIGVPTIAPATVGDEALDCRSVQDSNGDGQVNVDDVCIPVGGFISAVRPSRLVRGLVRAAALGIRVDESFTELQIPPPEELPNFDRLFISQGVNEAGMPVSVVDTLPANSTSFYLFFDYENMQDGIVYELRTTIDGRPNPTFSLPSVTWNGGERGMWYIGTSGQPLPNGVYEFTLFIQGRQVATHQMLVGGAPQQIPIFRDLSFGLQDNVGAIVGTGFVIPETNIVRAQFGHLNMAFDMEWTQVWYLEDAELARTTLAWTGEPEGVNTEPAIQSESGLISGRYRLELYIEGRLAATSDFVIAGGADGSNADIFSNITFALSQTAGQPTLPTGRTFQGGLESLYVFFDWRQLSVGTPWTWRWKVDNDTLFSVSTQWAAPADGQFYYLSLGGVPILPDGTYTFEIEMGGIVLFAEDVRVGLGQLPIDAFASAEGIQLTGRIIDAETGRGIPGALFIMLLVEFSVEDFLWDESQILATSLADEDGFFQLPALLERGPVDDPLLYSLLVRADGYLPMSADGIAVTTETESPLELIIELNRD